MQPRLLWVALPPCNPLHFLFLRRLAFLSRTSLSSTPLACVHCLHARLHFPEIVATQNLGEVAVSQPFKLLTLLHSGLHQKRGLLRLEFCHLSRKPRSLRFGWSDWLYHQFGVSRQEEYLDPILGPL